MQMGCPHSIGKRPKCSSRPYLRHDGASTSTLSADVASLYLHTSLLGARFTWLTLGTAGDRDLPPFAPRGRAAALGVLVSSMVGNVANRLYVSCVSQENGRESGFMLVECEAAVQMAECAI